MKKDFHRVILFMMFLLISGCKPEPIRFEPPTQEISTSIPATSTSAIVVTEEVLSISGVALPGEETRIELEDGAAIVIPESSVDQEVTVTVERNPEKIRNLPPLGDGVVQLGEFYNFIIEEGELLGPVDLILPFDEESIPDNAGVLTIAIPAGDSWEFIPVMPEGDRVTFYTDNVGDPVIAWNFNVSEEKMDEISEYGWCDRNIPLAMSFSQGPKKTTFTLEGQIVPVDKNLVDYISGLIMNESVSQYAGGSPVEIIFNNDSDNSVNTIAGFDGGFSYQFTSDEIELKKGLNRIKVVAECNTIWSKALGNPTSFSTGYINFAYHHSPSESQTEEGGEDNLEENATVEEIKPEGSVELPDFIGQDIDDAIEWLKENGFGYTWIDGSSRFELGQVYRQLPSAGAFHVPHRTTVLLYRSAEQSKENLPFTYVKYDCVEHYFAPFSYSGTGQIRQDLYTDVCEGGHLIEVNDIKINSNGEIECDVAYHFSDRVEQFHTTIPAGKWYYPFGVPDPEFKSSIPEWSSSPSDDGRITVRSEINLAFSHEETITVHGQERETLVFNREYNTINNDPEGSIFPNISSIIQYKDYVDKNTGLILRTEYRVTNKECKPECPDYEGVLIDYLLTEIIDIDW